MHNISSVSEIHPSLGLEIEPFFTPSKSFYFFQKCDQFLNNFRSTSCLDFQFVINVFGVYRIKKVNCFHVIHDQFFKNIFLIFHSGVLNFLITLNYVLRKLTRYIADCYENYIFTRKKIFIFGFFAKFGSLMSRFYRRDI